MNTDVLVVGAGPTGLAAACGLLMLPKTGHTINLEEPDWFNLFLANFIATVEAGRWGERDPRSLARH